MAEIASVDAGTAQVQIAVEDDGSLSGLVIDNDSGSWFLVGFSPDEFWSSGFCALSVENGTHVNWTTPDLALRPPLDQVRVKLHPANPEDPPGFQASLDTREPCDGAVLASYILGMDGSLTATGCAQDGSL